MASKSDEEGQKDLEKKDKKKGKREKFPVERKFVENSDSDVQYESLSENGGDDRETDRRRVIKTKNSDKEEVRTQEPSYVTKLRSYQDKKGINNNAQTIPATDENEQQKISATNLDSDLPKHSKQSNTESEIDKSKKGASVADKIKEAIELEKANQSNSVQRVGRKSDSKRKSIPRDKIDSQRSEIAQFLNPLQRTGDGIAVEVKNSKYKGVSDSDSSSTTGSEMDSAEDSESHSGSNSSNDDEASSSESEDCRERQSRKRGRARSPHRKSKRERNDRATKKYHKKLLKENPELRSYVEKKISKKRSNLTPRDVTPKRKRKSKKKGENLNLTPRILAKKSPSVDTAYTPAVRPRNPTNPRSPVVKGDLAVDPNMINEYLRQIRLGTQTDQGNSFVEKKRRQESESEQSMSESVSEPTPKEIAEAAILRAEEFKATLVPPNKGKLFEQRLTRGHDDDEDDFFSMTCHVDKQLKEKIARGDFVELEKLLPKQFKGGSNQTQDFKMNLMNKDGMNFWVPAPEKEQKINGIRKWDQAFRIYASLFTYANPERGAEIMQYIHTINNAAMTFAWDNVAHYDYYFRQKMAQKPYKSWAKTFMQLWTVSMVNPIVKTPGFGSSSHAQNVMTSGSGTGAKKDWREISCWRFNRNKCTKPPGTCRFEHRCSYCGSFTHIYPACPKKPKKPGQSRVGSNEDNTKRVYGDDQTTKKANN